MIRGEGDRMEIIKERAMLELCCRRAIKDKADGSFHWHENYEICRIINKPMRFRIDGEIVSAAPGDIVVIEEQVVHQFITDEDGTEICIIQFHPGILFGNDDRKIAPKRHITMEEILAVEGLSEQIDALLLLMSHERETENAKSNPYFKSLMSALYFLLRRHFGAALSGVSGSRKVFYTVANYINSNYCEDISVNSLAATFYFSRGKLSSVFKKYSGVSITDYVGNLRIRKANAMLSAGSSVTEAAFESGFKNIRSFNNVYKKIMGMTPREYLRGNAKKK